jgi:E3 ubiquitin-protein ligase RNF19A
MDVGQNKLNNIIPYISGDESFYPTINSDIHRQSIKSEDTFIVIKNQNNKLLKDDKRLNNTYLYFKNYKVLNISMLSEKKKNRVRTSYSARLKSLKYNKIVKKLETSLRVSNKIHLKEITLEEIISDEFNNSDIKLKHKKNSESSLLKKNPRIVDDFEISKKKSNLKISRKISEMCPICLDTIEDSFTLNCCKMTFCLPCLEYHTEYKLKNFYIEKSKSSTFSIICPNRECKNLVMTEEDIMKILNTNEKNKYIRIKELVKLANQDGVVLCPIPDCNSYVVDHVKDQVKLKCGNAHDFCRNCMKAYHTDSCNKDEVQLEVIKQLNIKKCPKCQILMEKKEGCNHMTCGNYLCKYEFCWICLGKYDTSHYSNPMSPCYSRANDDNDTMTVFHNNKCLLFLKRLGIVFLFIFIIILAIPLFSVLLGLWAYVQYYDDRIFESKITLKSSGLSKFHYAIVLFSYLLIGFYCFSIGIFIFALLVVTSPLIGLIYLIYKSNRSFVRVRRIRARPRFIRDEEDYLFFDHNRRELATSNLRLTRRLLTKKILKNRKSHSKSMSLPSSKKLKFGIIELCLSKRRNSISFFKNKLNLPSFIHLKNTDIDYE